MSIEIDFKLTRPSRDERPPFVIQVKISTNAGIVGIMGPSGSGKTSLLDALAGIATNVTGHIRLGDTLILDTAKGVNVPVRKRRIGYVFQDAQLFPHLSVEENLRFSTKGRSGPNPDWDPIVSMLRLESLLKANSRELSGGERQRVALGRAMMSKPHVLLLDEPLTGVELEHRLVLLPFLLDIQKARNIKVFYVSHQGDEISKLADECYSMKAGKLEHRNPVTSVSE